MPRKDKSGKSKYVTALLPMWQVELLDKIANEREQSVSATVKQIVRFYMEKNKLIQKQAL